MSIDVHEEPLIRLAEVPAALPWLPKGRGGRPLNPSTLFRWATIGLRDRGGQTVRLEAVRAGGALATSEGAVKRFFGRLSGDDVDAPPIRTASQRNKSHAAAESRLAGAGI